MANLAYRSVIGATNWSATTSWNVYSLPAVGGVFPSGGTWGVASDYPKTGDYVWISSTASVTYDATAIATNNSATFALISNNINSSSSAVAQPGTGGANATTGTISLSIVSTTTINATYYNILSGTAGLFNIVTTSNTYNFTGTWYEGTTGSWIVAPSGSNNTVNVTGNIKSSASSGNGISFTNANTLNYTGTATGQGGILFNLSANSTLNITGDVYISGTQYTVYSTSSATVTITGNIYSGTNQSAIYLPAAGSSVTVTGNIRNYGTSGTTSYMAIICPVVNLRSTATIQFRTSDAGVKDYTTSGATTVTEASIWSYATRVLTAATNITSNGSTIDQTKISNLDATVSSRLATSGYTAPANASISDIKSNTDAIKTSTDRIPTNPASVQSTGDQISALQ